MKFHYDPFENHEVRATQPLNVLEPFMSWAEEEVAYGKKPRVAYR